MNRLLGYLQADLHRAENSGDRSVQINTGDLRELLNAYEAQITRDKGSRANKHAGWAKPFSLADLLSGQARNARISRRKSIEFNTEVFFGDDLMVKKQEYLDALALAGADPQ